MGDMNTFTCEGKDLVESKRLKIRKMEGLLIVKGSRKGEGVGGRERQLSS